jgi:hypothetical protein
MCGMCLSTGLLPAQYTCVCGHKCPAAVTQSPHTYLPACGCTCQSTDMAPVQGLCAVFSWVRQLAHSCLMPLTAVRREICFLLRHTCLCVPPSQRHQLCSTACGHPSRRPTPCLRLSHAQQFWILRQGCVWVVELSRRECLLPAFGTLAACVLTLSGVEHGSLCACVCAVPRN